MKHLKTFENISTQYKEGDYVLVLSEYNKIDEEAMKLVKYVDNYTTICTFLNQGNREYSHVRIFTDEIIRKLEPFEIDSLKFNI